MRHPGIQGLLPNCPEIRSKRKLKKLLARCHGLPAEDYNLVRDIEGFVICVPPSKTGRKFRPITRYELKERNLRP